MLIVTLRVGPLPTTLRLTPRDLEIIRVLCLCVRYLSMDQLRRGWWQTNSRAALAAEARIRKLVKAEWLGKSSLLARPIPKIDGPLYVWHPGDRVPDFGHFAWRAKSRWKSPPVMTSVIYAGPKASRFYVGTRPRKVRQIYQLTHDLGVAEVYLHFKDSRPAEAANWCGEATNPFRKRHVKNADVYIYPEHKWPPKLVVDFAGAYPKSRIQALHDYCSKNQLAYELW